jgi:hypothetical protein
MTRNHASLPRWLLRGLTLCLVLASVGCGSKGTVSGKITYNGKPLPSGTVTFVPEKGSVVTAAIVDGKYTAEKVPTGPAKILVTSVSGGNEGRASFANQGKNAMMNQMKNIPEDAPIPPEARKSLAGGNPARNGLKIPTRYNDTDKTDLKYTVKSGNQDHDIELK